MESIEEVEQALKRKMKGMLLQMVNFGTIKGFVHFATYMRGKEEMIISIVNEPQAPDNAQADINEYIEPNQTERKGSFGASLTSGNLPYDKRSLMLSARSQMMLSGYGDIGVGLPPASPSDHETVPKDDNCTLFLIAGYARYNCPYVWVRSNHERLVRLAGNKPDDNRDKDNPLKLKSTTKWKDQDIHIWDIVCELVRLNCYPSPLNPFAVDWSYFESLPLSERVLSTGAMLHLLQKIHISHQHDTRYTPYLLADTKKLSTLHFTCLQMLIQDHSLGSVSSANRRTSATPTSTKQPMRINPSAASSHQHPQQRITSCLPRTAQSAKSNRTLPSRQSAAPSAPPPRTPHFQF